MSRFSLQAKICELELENPFSIARGTKETVHNVVVMLSADGVTGYGEAGPNKRYDEDAETVLRYLDQVAPDFFNGIKEPDLLSDKIDALSQKPVKSAQAAIEMAWLDWWGKSQQQPLWKFWQTPSQKTPSTSFTIGLDEIDVMQRKVKEAGEYPILKVKLGTDRDREIIEAIREITDKPIRVDANEGWEDLAIAKEQIDFLAEQNIEIVEQPMPSAMHDEMAKLKEWSPLPLMADESFKGDEDLDHTTKAFDGINIKLMKIGSLVKARRVMEEARQRGLQVMIGCMIESSLANAAGALLGTWADYVDLDGHLLIKDDPFSGLGLDKEKRLVLSDRPGLGVERNNTL